MTHPMSYMTSCKTTLKSQFSQPWNATLEGVETCGDRAGAFAEWQHGMRELGSGNSEGRPSSQPTSQPSSQPGSRNEGRVQSRLPSQQGSKGKGSAESFDPSTAFVVDLPKSDVWLSSTRFDMLA